MKIGDRVFVRGYIDEIRKDTVIIRNAGGYFGTIPSEVITGDLPSAQPEPCEDAVSRKLMYELGATCMARRDENGELVALGRLDMLPSVQPVDKDTNVPSNDCISRQAAIDAIDDIGSVDTYADRVYAKGIMRMLPSAQPERTCVNCGRTVNNGGWYADGGTRCPIEEHYALPKDGYCHLWEKRNVTDDDYPERREE